MIERAAIWFVPSANYPVTGSLAFDVDAEQAGSDNDYCVDVYDLLAGTCTRHASTTMQASLSCPASFDMVGSADHNGVGLHSAAIPTNQLIMADWLLVGQRVMPVLSASLTTCPDYASLVAYIMGNGQGVISMAGVADATAMMYTAINRLNVQYSINRSRLTDWMEIALLSLYPDGVELPDHVKDKLDALVQKPYMAPATVAKRPRFNRSGWR